MQAEARRVALLARPGAARDRLRALLDEAGVACVLDADPTATGVGALVDAAPNVVLIALDAATEDVLDRFDAVTGNTSVDVIFEEAEYIVSREGWDAARWQRHLIAKLQRHDNVLPPVPMGEDEAPESIAFPTDDDTSLADIAAEFAQTADAAVEEAVAEAVADASGHPIDGTLLDGAEGSDSLAPFALGADIAGAGLGARVAEADPHPFDPSADYDFDSASLEAEVDGFGLEARVVESPAPQAHPFDSVGADALSWDEPAAAPVAIEAASMEVVSFDPSAFDAEFDPASFDASAFDAPSFDAPRFDDALPAASDPGGFAAREDVASAFDVAFDASRAEIAADLAPALDAPTGDKLELTLDDGTGSMAPDTSTAANRFRHDLDDLHARISTLELVDDTPKRGPEQARGAVLVLAGIGGPDAVRQLLGALPADFARPVLVQQRLDGGRYDKLVAQMQRATTLPVKLAEPGAMALAGTVYILPDTVGVESQGDTLRFNTDAGGVLQALPAADSAILMFSGSDATLVDAAMNHSWGGALVAGQLPDGCYDPTAPAALVARGAEAGQPAELASRLVARWTH